MLLNRCRYCELSLKKDVQTLVDFCIKRVHHNANLNIVIADYPKHTSNYSLHPQIISGTLTQFTILRNETPQQTLTKLLVLVLKSN